MIFIETPRGYAVCSETGDMYKGQYVWDVCINTTTFDKEEALRAYKDELERDFIYKNNKRKEAKMKIRIEQEEYGMTVESTLSKDATLEDVIDMFRGMLLSLGYHQDGLYEVMPEETDNQVDTVKELEESFKRREAQLERRIVSDTLCKLDDSIMADPDFALTDNYLYFKHASKLLKELRQKKEAE